MKVQDQVTLAPYTSLHCGGIAERVIFCTSLADVREVLSSVNSTPLWILGYGTNVLISDKGLPGTTLLLHGGEINRENDMLIADAGAWWDDVVRTSIEHELWGIELMSGIPGSVGAAVSGNIAAYGQQAASTLAWIEILDTSLKTLRKMSVAEIMFDYRSSSLQDNPELIITRAAFKLSRAETTPLTYESARVAAVKLNLNVEDLTDRREIILEARRRAGSLYLPTDPTAQYTAGSFFKNPLVSAEQALQLASFDETGKSLERIMKQNQVHGGTSKRVSAAHVLLAAGFSRGQTWGNVRLHPKHVLKLENTGGATAQEIYTVAQEIIQTVKQKLEITLEPEVKFLGDFK